MLPQIMLQVCERPRPILRATITHKTCCFIFQNSNAFLSHCRRRSLPGFGNIIYIADPTLFRLQILTLRKGYPWAIPMTETQSPKLAFTSSIPPTNRLTRCSSWPPSWAWARRAPFRGTASRTFQRAGTLPSSWRVPSETTHCVTIIYISDIGYR